jgi:type I restriction enzyme S subunit
VTEVSIASVAVLSGFHDGDWVESKDQDPDGEIRLLQLADVGDGVFRDRSDRRINEEVFERLNCSPVWAGDVLIARMPDPLGRACIVPSGLGRAVTVVDVAVLRCDEAKADRRYVTYAINATPTRSYMESLQDGATRQRIPRKRLGRVQIPFPPLADQRAIADYLDSETTRIDTLVEEQQRLVEMLRERRAAVISSVLAPTDSWVRRRIKHIGETSLGKMLDAGRAVRDGDQPRPYVRAADVRADGSVNLVDLNEMPFSDAEMEVFDLRTGDVLLIEGGATVGRPGFMFESAPGIAFQKTVNRLRAGPQTDARFVYWSMLRLYESAYYANHYGSVSFVHLTGEKLREIELHLPPLDEQRAIATYLDEQTLKIDALIAETERFIELARERRAALIAAAVTGQVDVREMA